MATDYDAFITVSSNIGDTFLNASNNDMLIYTESSNQRILIGSQQNGNAAIIVRSNAVDISQNMTVNANLNITGLVTQGGQSLGTQFINNGGNIYLIGSNVGIGLSNASSLISLYDSNVTNPSNAVISFTSTKTGYGGPARVGLGSNGNLLLWHTSNYGVKIGTNNQEVMTITNQGLVGIAKSNPGFTLDVGGSINFTGSMLQNGAPYPSVVPTGFATNLSTVYVVDSNVGIGTSNANTTTLLHLNASNLPAMIGYTNNIVGNGIAYTGMGSNGSLIVWHTSNNAICFGTSNREVMRINSNGNVGILTGAPNYNLDVNGTLGASNLFIGYKTVLSNQAYVLGSFTACNSSRFTSDVIIDGQLTVNSVQYINSNVIVTNSETIQDNLTVQDDATIGGNFGAIGNAVFYSNVMLSNSAGFAGLYANQSRLGINKTVPVYTLDVNGPINALGYCNLLTNDNTSTSQYTAPSSFALSFINAKTNFASNSVGNTWTSVNYSSSNSIYTAVTNPRVSIGKSQTSYMLDVAGDINFDGILRKNGVAYIGSQWSNNSSNVFLFGSNVGVGLSNPIYPLDVIGDINYTGVLRSNGIVISNPLTATVGGFYGSNGLIPGYAIVRGATNNGNYTFLTQGAYETGAGSFYDQNNTTFTNFDQLGGYSGSYFGTASSTNGVTGAWTQIQSTVAFPLTGYTMAFANGAIPTEWYVFGSTDGTTFTQVDRQAFTWSNASQVSGTITLSSQSAAYNYYRLVFNKAPGTLSLATLQWISTSFPSYSTLPSGYLAIGSSAPLYNLDISGDINYTGTLRQNGVPYIGSQWSNNSSNVFLFNSNVGIGISNPQAQLHITSNLRVDGSIQLYNAVQFTGIEFIPGVIQNNSSQVVATTSNIQGYSNALYGASNGTILSIMGNTVNDTWRYLSGTTSNEVYRITGTGFHGILKSNPAYPLDVVGDINYTGTLRQNGTAVTLGGGTSKWTNSGANIYITSSNVGIGTSSPSSRLHVFGPVLLENNNDFSIGLSNNAGTGSLAELALAYAGGRYSGAASAGDLVIRNISKNIYIQCGSGNPSIAVLTNNNTVFYNDVTSCNTLSNFGNAYFASNINMAGGSIIATIGSASGPLTLANTFNIQNNATVAFGGIIPIATNTFTTNSVSSGSWLTVTLNSTSANQIQNTSGQTLTLYVSLTNAVTSRSGNDTTIQWYMINTTTSAQSAFQTGYVTAPAIIVQPNEYFTIRQVTNANVQWYGASTFTISYATNTLVQSMVMNSNGLVLYGGAISTNNSNVNFNYQVPNASLSHAFFTGGVLRSYINSLGIFPATDNSLACGLSGNRWSAVYAANGTIQTSDSSEKDFIPLPYGISNLMQVNTIQYKWKSQAFLSNDDPSKYYQYYGVIADELDTIFPELVYNEKQPFQLNYSELVPICINAIKDLKNEIDAKDAIISNLVERIEKLEKRIMPN